MSKMLSEKTISTIKKIRKGYLNTVLWILVAELVLWVVMILVSKSLADENIGKAQTMFLTFVACAFLNIGAFKNIEVGNEKSRIFAVVSLVTSIIAAILDVFLIWEVFPGLDTARQLSVMSKLTLIFLDTAITSLIAACVMLMKDEVKVGRILLMVFLLIIYFMSLIAIIGPEISEKFIMIITVVPFSAFLIWLFSYAIKKMEGGNKNDSADGSEKQI